ncbi:hypothetical protein B0A48_15760 [Cryoendolithus antarcticus]|uniref:Uncharacterized protein n=1 Tax=Cryoendolithus antarcticus TaxID=1507870 RepID=A0A1V8SHC7_9PEZI|nr:hypothetical protein B0A48_15760 [Cryoendolithus antarcticus]
MSPTGIAASQLRQLIFYHLDNDMLDNANFLAGRLHALEPRNPDSSHLLALTYLRKHRNKAAYDAAQKYGSNGRHLGCAYVFAQACLALERNVEGTSALEKARSHWQGKSSWGKTSETSRRHLPDAPAVQTLLAKLWQAHGDLRKAADCYVEAHKANPFIWSSFEGLCDIGADLDVDKMFRHTEGMGYSGKAAAPSEVYQDQPRVVSRPLASQPNFINANILTPSSDPFNNNRPMHAESGFVLPKVPSKQRIASEWDTPTVNSSGDTEHEDTAMSDPLGQDLERQERLAVGPRHARVASSMIAPDRARHGARGVAAVVSHSTAGPPIPSGRTTAAGAHKRTVSGAPTQSSMASGDSSGPPRRSNRLFGQGPATKSGRSAVELVSSVLTRTDREVRPARAATGTKGRSTVGRVVSGNRTIKPPDPSEKDKDNIRRAPSRNSEKSVGPPASHVVASTVQLRQVNVSSIDQQAEQEALGGLLKSLKQLAIGRYAASNYDLSHAIASFDALPTSQRETPWVLAQLGKAHYEAADYREAEVCFTKLMKLQPSRIEDMEVFSTVLWHLKKDSTLAWLCHTLRDQHYNAPETWCAVGNSFSLAREHDHAISAFKRATQMSPNFAYAWTLMGHEYIANEEFDAALSAFRKSVAADKRAYGGWYGLGRSFERMGKLEEAERHYRIAASINPSNSTLLVCIGVIYEKLHKKENALDCYTRALVLTPGSALARFKKARVLMHMRDFPSALEELEFLKGVAPDEANVWFLLGKCLKGLGARGEALKAFTTALNLDVKASQFIKEAMESLEDDEDMESEED